MAGRDCAAGQMYCTCPYLIRRMQTLSFLSPITEAEYGLQQFLLFSDPLY